MLQEGVDWLLYNIIGLDATSKLGQILNFFVYDTIKIILLLFAMISIVGFLRTYIPPSKIKEWLGHKAGWMANVYASLFGTLTHFCSCSSIPIFLSFLEAGVPLGVGFSFLITSPLVNEYLVVLMLGFFGWKITLAYVISGVLIGVVSGIILGKMNLDKEIVHDIIKKREDMKDKVWKSLKERIMFGLTEARDIVKKIWMWILVGVGLGAVIHNLVPDVWIQKMIGKGRIFTVPAATLLGVPMYANCAAIVPVALVLFQKGIPIGTALAFMMATAALSLPEAIILRRAMKLRLILIFFTIVTIGIIFTGYLLNVLQPILMAGGLP